MLEDMWESLTNASNEAIEIFKSAFNVTGTCPHPRLSSLILSLGAIPTKPKPGKMFYFGDPSEFDMADLSANPSQVFMVDDSKYVPDRSCSCSFTFSMSSQLICRLAEMIWF